MTAQQIRRKNRRAGLAWLKHRWPVGVDVRVRRDNGDDFCTVTRSEPWQLHDGTWVIQLERISSFYTLERVTVTPTRPAGQK